MTNKDSAEISRSQRNEFFKDTNDEEDLWIGKNLWIGKSGQKKSGYSMVPRPMPIIFKIMDSLSNGKPISSTFFALWCRDRYSTSFLRIDNPSVYALESGFSHSRKEYTWQLRMTILEKHGFIKSREGNHGKFSYVLIRNPFIAIKELYERGVVDKDLYLDLMHRADNVQSDEVKILKEAYIGTDAQTQGDSPEKANDNPSDDVSGNGDT